MFRSPFGHVCSCLQNNKEQNTLPALFFVSEHFLTKNLTVSQVCHMFIHVSSQPPVLPLMNQMWSIDGYFLILSLFF